MWSHDAGTNTVIVYYMGEDRASEKPDYFETVDGKNIQHLRITLPDNDGHTVPRSDTTANDVTQTLQALVNSKTTESNKFKWKLFTIAFKTITESGEKVWRTDGTDNVELAKDFKAFIFNNKGPKFAACRNIECLINLPQFLPCVCRCTSCYVSR
eukprot:GHVU01025911.1.p1 GENE.GHVU01025911.1~~GHVU01025911.1.p1  ORF type:complete len:155 (+),score=12.77 GHVU01025911.1:165-629(+)